MQDPTANSSTPSPDTPSTLVADSSMSHVDVSGSHAPGSVSLSLSPLRLVRGGRSVSDLVCSAENVPVHICVHVLYSVILCHAVVC